MNPHVILQGIVGSTAYGLAREGSDVDRLGVYTLPPRQLLGLDKGPESIVSKDPDRTHHELGKFVRLLMKGNPTVMELLWLPEYEVCDYVFGNPLVENRGLFLSQKTVRSAYLGYAGDQLRRAEARGDGSFTSDTKNRSIKHARHCMRLLEQAWILYEYGHLHLRVANPWWYLSLDDEPWEDVLAEMRTMFENTKEKIDNSWSPLPKEIDQRAVSDLLDSLRMAQVWYGERGTPINEAVPTTPKEK
jgi:hypothetical protein